MAPCAEPAALPSSKRSLALEERQAQCKRVRRDSTSSEGSTSETITRCITSSKLTAQASNGSSSKTVHSFGDSVTPITPASPAPSASPGRNKQAREKKFLCKYTGCGKAFTRPVRLEEHERSHRNERPFICSQDGCDKAFLRATHLNAHYKSAHTTVRDYVCDFAGCDKSFTTGTRLRRHRERHEKPTNFSCQDYAGCERTFRKHSALQRHIQRDHLGILPFKCEEAKDDGSQCGAMFESMQKLHRHERKAHGNHVCLVCTVESDNGEPAMASVFHTVAELQNHVKTVHPLKCDLCSFKPRTAKELDRHIEAQHSGQPVEQRKIFDCEYVGCSKSFTRKHNLQVHVKSAHEKVKPFVCGQTDVSQTLGLEMFQFANGCGAEFAYKNSLEGHIRNKHQTAINEASTTPMNVLPGTIMLEPVQDRQSLQPVNYQRLNANATFICPFRECALGLDTINELRDHFVAIHSYPLHAANENAREQAALQGGDFWLASNEYEAAEDALLSADWSQV